MASSMVPVPVKPGGSPGRDPGPGRNSVSRKYFGKIIFAMDYHRGTVPGKNKTGPEFRSGTDFHSGSEREVRGVRELPCNLVWLGARSAPSFSRAVGPRRAEGPPFSLKLMTEVQVGFEGRRPEAGRRPAV